MSIQDRLKNIFGWGDKTPPTSLPKLGDPSTLANNHFLADSYNKAMDVPESREELYDVYEEMDEGEASIVLDTYAGDAAQFDMEHGSRIWVEAKNQKTKKVLENLFDRLNIQQDCEALIRDLAKNGDEFFELSTEPLPDNDLLHGSLTEQKLLASSRDVKPRRVNSWVPRDPRHVKRLETDTGLLLGFTNTSDSNKLATTDNKIDYRPWEVVHFRLLRRKYIMYMGQSFKNLYGTSILYPAIRASRQLKMMDDLLMMHRILRSLDRHIYYIDVGHASRESEMQILRRWKSALRRKSWIDPSSKKFTTRWDPMCLTGDTLIPLLDGTSVSIKDLVGKKDFWVYSSTLDGKIVPGKGHSARLTKKDAPIYKVTLDNNETIKCTDNHPFLLKNGEYVHAVDLKAGDSLMPLYRKLDKNGYEECWCNKSQEWVKTHWITASRKPNVEEEVGNHLVRHHKDFNKKNNNPHNLEWVTFRNHGEIHSKYLKEMWKDEAYREMMFKVSSKVMTNNWSNEDFRNMMSETSTRTMNKLWEDETYREMMSNLLSDMWKSPEFREFKTKHTSEQMKRRWEEDHSYRERMLEVSSSVMKNNWDRNRDKMLEVCSNGGKQGMLTNWSNKDFRNRASTRTKKMNNDPTHQNKAIRGKCLKVVEVIKNSKDTCDITRETWNLHRKLMGNCGYPTYDTALKCIPDIISPNNHKVVSIVLCGKEDVYDITVDEHHNFALEAGVIVHNSFLEDIFWPTKEGSNSRVETLQGQPDVKDIVDHERFVSKFYGTLGAPKGYFGHEDASGSLVSKSTLSQQDISFGRKVSSIQMHFLNGLTRLCQIELAYRNMDASPHSFQVKMVRPSSLEELQRIENMMSFTDAANNLVGFGETANLNMAEWVPYVLENTMGLSKEEIEKFTSPNEDGEEVTEKDKMLVSEIVSNLISEVDLNSYQTEEDNDFTTYCEDCDK